MSSLQVDFERAALGGAALCLARMLPLGWTRVLPLGWKFEAEDRARVDRSGTLVLLATAADTPEQWLRAGQALERVLLTATVRGLATTPMSQPLEVPRIRELLTDRAAGTCPQIILRVGYGPASAGSPRRPLDDVVIAPTAP